MISTERSFFPPSLLNRNRALVEKPNPTAQISQRVCALPAEHWLRSPADGPRGELNARPGLNDALRARLTRPPPLQVDYSSPRNTKDTRRSSSYPFNDASIRIPQRERVWIRLERAHGESFRQRWLLGFAFPADGHKFPLLYTRALSVSGPGG